MQNLKMFTIGTLMIMIIGMFTTLSAQSVRSSLFNDTDVILQNAKKAQAPLLSPKYFGKGIDSYKEADNDLKEGKNLEGIRKKLREANIYFSKAIDVTKLAEVTFISQIKARADAENAGSIKYASELWEKAEEKFKEAATKLEDGDVNGAKKRAGEAEALYREAELNAIKTSYLEETWNLLAQADKMHVKDTAPETLAKSQKLIQDAEKELTNNRYDTDVARNLAQQANYEVKHAIYLNNLFKKFKKEKMRQEDLILTWETPLQQIAANMDLVAEFNQGYEKPTQQIIGIIHSYQDSLINMNQKLADRDEQIASLQGRITELENQLGTVAKQQSAMQNRLEAQAKVREQFSAVEKIFNHQEARVLRESNDVIIRLVGLNFASGKSVIEPQYFTLLTKVQNAILTFPDSKITIEGHTDSFGGDELNLRLSQERANAVRQYLLANLRNLRPDQIEAIGFGESQPIANNETVEGRTKNRRIDVAIHPQLTQIQ